MEKVTKLMIIAMSKWFLECVQRKLTEIAFTCNKDCKTSLLLLLLLVHLSAVLWEERCKWNVNHVNVFVGDLFIIIAVMQ